MSKIRNQKTIGQKKIDVECRGCGWIWTPSPRLWRNRRNPMRGRTLKCPNCGLPNRISAQDVKRIWRYNY